MKGTDSFLSDEGDRAGDCRPISNHASIPSAVCGEVPHLDGATARQINSCVPLYVTLIKQATSSFNAKCQYSEGCVWCTQEDPVLRELTASEPLTLEAGATRVVCIANLIKQSKKLILP